MNKCYICGKEVHENIDYAAVKDKNGNEGVVRSLIKGPDDPTPRWLCRDHLRMFLFFSEFMNATLMSLCPLEDK